MGFPGGSLERICLPVKRLRFIPWINKIPWRRKWQPTPVLMPGESHGQRSLVCYSLFQRVGHDLVTKQQQQKHGGLRNCTPLSPSSWGAIFNSYVPTPFPLRYTPSQEPIILYLQSNLHPSSRSTGHVFLYTHIFP